MVIYAWGVCKGGEGAEDAILLAAQRSLSVKVAEVGMARNIVHGTEEVDFLLLTAIAITEQRCEKKSFDAGPPEPDGVWDQNGINSVDAIDALTKWSR
jgi:hypothetical protein